MMDDGSSENAGYDRSRSKEEQHVIVAGVLLLVLLTSAASSRLCITPSSKHQSVGLSFFLIELVFLLVDAEQVGDVYSFFRVLRTLHMHMMRSV